MAHDFSHKILIVDDEQSAKKNLEKILLSEGLDYLRVESGKSAIEKIKSAKKPFSLILFNKYVPGVHGINFLEQAKQISPESIRFLISAYSDMDIIISSVNKGSVHKFISKPWKNDELLKLIHICLNQYEKFLEGESLFKIIKKQNKKLYNLDCTFMEIITEHDKQLAYLDKEILELEKQVKQPLSSVENFEIRICKQLEEFFISADKPNLEKINKLYTTCIYDLFEEFEDLANRNGFEMPQIISGAVDD